MHLTHLIRVILLGILLLIVLITGVLAIRKKSTRKKYLKIAGISFIAIFIVNFLMVKITNLLYPPTEKLGKLVFLAHGETSNKGYCWLGLYDDSTWEIGKSDREITGNGRYTISQDTIFLNTTEGTLFYSNEPGDFFIVNQNNEIELINTGIDGLNIVMNKFEKSSTNLY